MAKRTRIIEGTWTCSSCGTKGILARHKQCPSCNNPRELSGGESEFDFGETDAQTGKSLREGVTDEKAVDLAHAGADWFCAYCGASNRGDQTVCKNCKAERGQDAQALRERMLPGPTPPVPPKQGSGRLWLVLGGALLAVGLAVGLYRLWASQTHDYPGQLVGTEWKRSITQERFTPVTLEGWRDELSPRAPRMPVDGAGEVAGVSNIRGCVSARRGSRQVPAGTERVCRTQTRKAACGTEEKCQTRDKGNGFREEVCHDVTRYCDESYEDCRDETRYVSEPVYASRCSYDTYQWKPVVRREASGRDGEPPRWPELTTTAADRFQREEHYTLSVEFEKKGRQRAPFELKTEPEYLAWKKGQAVLVTVSNAGDIQRLAPR